MAAIIGFTAVILVMCWNMRNLKKEIYGFSDRLQECLEVMISGKELPNQETQRDSLWDKTYEKLGKLNHIWQNQCQSSMEEKRQIKELVSDLSHQTKTPLANIKIYQDILQNQDLDAAKRAEFLQKMREQTEKLDFLLQSMVKISRLETGIIEIHSKKERLCDTLGGALSAIVPKAEEKQIRLSAHCGEEIMVSHDRKWTEEAIFNILDNGVKYTQEGGSIHISVSVQEFFTKISIRDNGKGIAKERQAQIFSRFYREPEVCDVQGIGVGLYLARKILTLQNGYIEVRSEKGKGSEFRVFLPNELSHS